ncbi:MAG: methyltetrahydrofolate cobalamin methyltransferase, partial [Geminicoccaceae bacterium]
PNRHGLNPAFIAMAIGAGMTSAITNPLEASLMQAVRGANVLMNHDPDCRTWLKTFREPAAEGDNRRERRRRRLA